MMWRRKPEPPSFEEALLAVLGVDWVLPPDGAGMWVYGLRNAAGETFYVGKSEQHSHPAGRAPQDLPGHAHVGVAGAVRVGVAMVTTEEFLITRLKPAMNVHGMSDEAARVKERIARRAARTKAVQQGLHDRWAGRSAGRAAESSVSAEHVHHHGLLAGLGAGAMAVLVAVPLLLWMVWHRIAGAVGTAAIVIIGAWLASAARRGRGCRACLRGSAALRHKSRQLQLAARVPGVVPGAGSLHRVPDRLPGRCRPDVPPRSSLPRETHTHVHLPPGMAPEEVAVALRSPSCSGASARRAGELSR